MGIAKQETQMRSIKVDQKVLYKLRTKFQRAKVTDASALIDALNVSLDAIREQDAKPRQQDIEVMADMLDMVMENIEREQEERAARERSADEWRQMEYEYATVRDGMYSMTTIEALPEYDETKYRECAHRFCITAFKPRRKNAMYCSDECRRKEFKSIKEFERTSKLYANGTYLPIGAYMTNRDKYSNELYQENEVVRQPATITIMQDRKEVKLAPCPYTKQRYINEYETDREVEKAAANPRLNGEVTVYKLSEMSSENIEKTFGNSRISSLNPSLFSR